MEELKPFVRRVVAPAALVVLLACVVTTLVGQAAGPQFESAEVPRPSLGLDEEGDGTATGEWRPGRRRVSFRPARTGRTSGDADRSVVTHLPGRATPPVPAVTPAPATPPAPAASRLTIVGDSPSARPTPEPEPLRVALPPDPSNLARVPAQAFGPFGQSNAAAEAARETPVTPSEAALAPPETGRGTPIAAPVAGRGTPIAQIRFAESDFEGLGPRPIKNSGRPLRRAPGRPGEDGVYDAAVLGQGPVPPEPPPPEPPGFPPIPGATPAPEPAGGPAAAGGGEAVDVEFKDVDVRSIVKLISDKTKVNYMLDDQQPLSGKVTVLGPSKLTLQEAELLLMAVLEFKGYAIEEVGRKVRRIVTKEKAKSAFIPFQKQLTPASGPPKAIDIEKLVVQVFKLKSIGVNEMIQIIRFFATSASNILPYVPGNLLFVVDNEMNLRRIADLIAELDVPGPTRKITPIKVNHAQAKALADKVSQILAKRSEGETDPGTRESKLAKPALFADERTNTLLLICLEEDVRTFVALIEQLDVPDVYTPIIKVIHLQYSEAEAIANQVNQAFKVGGSGDPATQYSVIADARTQSLLLSSYSSTMLAKIEELIHFLDNAVTPADGINVHHYRMEYGDATKVEKILSGMDTSGSNQKNQSPTKIIADETTNSLVIVASKSKYQDILKLLQKLDTLRPQVMVEALMVQLTQSMANQIGADFNIIPADATGSRVVGLGKTGAVSQLFNSSSNGGMHLGVIAPGSFDINAAAQGNVAEQSKIQYLLNLFKNDNRSNVLQAPRLMAADNSTAKITVGEKVQVLQGYSQTSVAGQVPMANFTSEDLGLTMEITPRITKGDWVSMKLKAEFKGRIQGSEGTINFGPFQTPVFTKTSVENEVLVKNRDTLVIGGLLNESKSKQESKIPGLGDIPILGRLFQSRNRSLDKKDLLVFMTPHIVRDQASARRVTKAEEKPLNWRDIKGHTWPHETGRPVTTPQLQEDLKRSGLPYRKIYVKPPRLEEAFRR